MLRTCADMGKPQIMKDLTDMALMILHVEPFLYDALQIDPTPAHDAVFLEVGAGFHDLLQFVQLFGAQTPLRPRRLAVDQPVQALRIEAVDRIPQGLPIHPPDPRSIATDDQARRSMSGTTGASGASRRNPNTRPNTTEVTTAMPADCRVNCRPGR